MIKNEKGSVYTNWVIIITVALILGVIITRVFVGENSLFKLKKEKDDRDKAERNITIEITNGINY